MPSFGPDISEINYAEVSLQMPPKTKYFRGGIMGGWVSG